MVVGSVDGSVRDSPEDADRSVEERASGSQGGAPGFAVTPRRKGGRRRRGRRSSSVISRPRMPPGRDGNEGQGSERAGVNAGFENGADGQGGSWQRPSWNAGYGSGWRRGGARGGGSPRVIRCYNCGKPGHGIRECRANASQFQENPFASFGNRGGFSRGGSGSFAAQLRNANQYGQNFQPYLNW